MALPSTGPISLNQIRTENNTASSNVSLRSNSNTSGKFSPDSMSEFRGYEAPGVVIDTISPSGTGTTYTYNTININAYVGQTRRLVFEYTSGADYRGDFQLGHRIQFGSTTYDVSSNSFETSRAGESSYYSTTWYTIATGTTSLRWNRRSGNTPSGGTGIDTSGYLTTFTYYGYTYSYWNNDLYKSYYAETSGTGAPNKKFWLRSPSITIPSSPLCNFYYGAFGATMGTLKVRLV